MKQFFDNARAAPERQSDYPIERPIEQLKTAASHPVFIAAAVVGTAVCAQQLYRFLRLKHKRPKWASKSRRPKVSHRENEVGDLAQVEALRSRTQH